jgi:FkbM family methyltransferase
MSWYKGTIYQKLLPQLKDKLVFDVGAAVGRMTRIFLDAGAQVVSIEPQSWQTQDNAAFDGATVYPVAVSDKIERIKFYQCINSPHTSTCLEAWTNGLYKIDPKKRSKYWKKIRIDAVTLDSLIEKHGVPFYVKIDVEGFENKVLAGLSHRPVYMSLEYTGGYKQIFEECLSHFKRLGYKKFAAYEKRKRGSKTNPKETRYIRYKFGSIDDFRVYFNKLPQFAQGDVLVY